MPDGAGVLSAAASDWPAATSSNTTRNMPRRSAGSASGRTVRLIGRTAAVGLDPHAAGGDGGLLLRGVVDGDAQLFAEPLAGHRKDVDVDLPRRRFQVLSGSPVDVDDVALGSDHHGGRAVRIQQHPLGRVENVHDRFLGFLGCRCRGALVAQHVGRHFQQASLAHFPALEDLPLLVQRREQVAEAADALGRAQDQAGRRGSGRSASAARASSASRH